MQTLAREVAAGRLKPEDIDAALFSRYLYTAGMPDPDLIIRTSGEYRLSNFLLWQSAYTELYVTETLWPDFREDEFLKALETYQQRQRRFGLTQEQIEALNDSEPRRLRMLGGGARGTPPLPLPQTPSPNPIRKCRGDPLGRPIGNTYPIKPNVGCALRTMIFHHRDAEGAEKCRVGIAHLIFLCIYCQRYHLRQTGSQRRPGRRAMRSWLAVSWTLAFLLLALLAALPQSALALTASQVYEQVKDSVVVVKAYDQQGKPVGLGSGVMLPSGDIITNYHVVKAGVRYTVGRGKKAAPATLKAGDPDKDLCLLTAPGLVAKPARLGKAARLKVGEPVYAVGAPQGLELSLSEGIVSQLRGGPRPSSRPRWLSPRAPAAAACSTLKENWWASPPST